MIGEKQLHKTCCETLIADAEKRDEKQLPKELESQLLDKWLIGPLQQCLTLLWPNVQSLCTCLRLSIFWIALDTTDMSGTKCLPPPNLNRINCWFPTPHEVSAIPLEPTTRIITINPPVLFPHIQWLPAFYLEIIAVHIRTGRTQFCILKPFIRELTPAIIDIFPLKDTHFQHFPRCQLCGKFKLSNRRSEGISIMVWHEEKWSRYYVVSTV